MHKKAPQTMVWGAFFRSRVSRGGRIRTYGLVVPNDARYRAALHPERDAALGTKPSFYCPKKASESKFEGFF